LTGKREGMCVQRARNRSDTALGERRLGSDDPKDLAQEMKCQCLWSSDSVTQKTPYRGKLVKKYSQYIETCEPF
jgi:hypothetical protein